MRPSGRSWAGGGRAGASRGSGWLRRRPLRVAIDETLRRFPRWDVERAGLERVHTSTVRGYKNVPIHY